MLLWEGRGCLDSVFFCGGKVLWAKACRKGGL
jgi:hypothetical protein